MRHFLQAAIFVSVCATAAPSVASGVVLSARQLSPEARQSLGEAIAQARRENPAAFTQLARLREQLPALDAGKRGALAPLPRALKALGPEALWPMVEMLVFESLPKGPLTDSAWLALRAGLLEAVGVLRDARTIPLFTAVLDASTEQTEVLRTAAEALGRIGDDTAQSTLLERAPRFEAAHQDAVLGALGNCRRLRTAGYLAQRLALETEPARAKRLVHALGDVGNAGAWMTAAVRRWADEETQTRKLAAQALVQAFLRFDGEVRQAASTALMVVDAPHTPRLLQDARAQAPSNSDLQGELDTLAQRFERNPSRLRR